MKQLPLAITCVSALMLVNSAHATLFDRGGGLIYDSALDVTWLQDASYGFGSIYDSIDGETDGRMRWWNAVPWAENLSYYDPIRDVTYEDWRLATVDPVDGVGYRFSLSYDGSTDFGHNIAAPGSAYPDSTASELASLYYNGLGNMSFCEVSTLFSCTPQAGAGLVNSTPFLNLQEGPYWSGTEFGGGTTAALFFAFGADNITGIFPSDVGAQFIVDKDTRMHVLAVRDGDVISAPEGIATPEPTTTALLAIGLLGVGYASRRRHHL